MKETLAPQPHAAPVEESTESVPVATLPRPRCYLCGGEGNELHARLRDQLYGVGGSWRLKQCRTPQCGLIWLDPMPVEAEIPRLYQNYHTHHISLMQQVIGWLGKAVAASRYDYHDSGIGKFQNWMGNLLSLNAELDEIGAGAIAWLSAHERGSLLEVGCGSGDFLARMRDLGWNVQGLEPDPAARSVCSARGVPCDGQTLESSRYSPGSFDVIVLSHVVEHLFDPKRTLQLCHTLLRTGGRLILLTPNPDSSGARRFGRDWRGWEPPRHLFLFSGPALHRTLAESGFQSVELRSTARSALMMWMASAQLASGSSPRQGWLKLKPFDLARGLFFHHRQQRATATSLVGEELLAVASKLS